MGVQRDGIAKVAGSTPADSTDSPHTLARVSGHRRPGWGTLGGFSRGNWQGSSLSAPGLGRYWARRPEGRRWYRTPETRVRFPPCPLRGCQWVGTVTCNDGCEGSIPFVSTYGKFVVFCSTSFGSPSRWLTVIFSANSTSRRFESVTGEEPY